MHITLDQLEASSDDELEELHNFCRCREKHFHRLGNWYFASAWGAIASEVLLFQFRREASAYARDDAPQADRLF